METDFRTLVRGFLLVGGIAFAAFGVVEGSTFNVGFGVVAAFLGGFGLWWERREPSDESG